MTNINSLKRELADIDRALQENKTRLALAPPHGIFHRSYLRQELEAEYFDLMRVREVTKNKLHTQATPAPLLNEHHNKFIDQMEAEHREATEVFIKKLEKEGDHRQARIWRTSLLDLRERLEQQCA